MTGHDGGRPPKPPGPAGYDGGDPHTPSPAGPDEESCPLQDARRGRAGAVYVEFLIAFLPVFFFFLSLVQLIFLQTASIITHHAAAKAVRAAAVVLPDDAKYYGDVPVGSFTGQRKSDIERAAKIPLATMGLIPAAAAKVTIEGGYSRNAMLTAKVEYHYHCKVPWGRFLICGFANLKKITAEASMTNQGAMYEY